MSLTLRALAAALIFTLLAAAAAPRRTRVLFLTGESDYPYHDWRASTPFLRSVLENTGRFDVRVAEEARGLTAATLAGFDVLVLNYNGPRWGPETERAVEDFIRSGKGMVTFHGVTYGEFFGMQFQERRWILPPGAKGWMAYADMLGCTWKPENIGHSVRHAFSVKWIDREHPISRGLEATFLANDELYHRLDLKPSARVLATAFNDAKMGGTSKEEPIVWVVPFGQGRVLHTTLGHDLSAMYQPGFLATFARGVEWAATGAVTLPAVIDALPARARDALRILVVTGGHGFPASFFTLFEGHADITWSHAGSQKEAFTPQLVERYDVLVLHDMHNEIGEKEQASLRAFVEAGRGVVSIHHAIVDYTAWPWWYQEVTGGKYFVEATPAHPKSSFKEHVEFVAQPVRAMAGHPVIRGLGPLPVVDEVYKNMWHSSGIAVLMEAEHPLNDRPVVYAGPHPKARSIYIQMGHSDATMRHPGYHKLVRNAILWCGRRLE